MNVSYKKYEGKIDELLDCLFQIIQKIHEDGYESVRLEDDVWVEKPYQNLLREGLDLGSDELCLKYNPFMEAMKKFA